jgi:hypothetical protein
MTSRPTGLPQGGKLTAYGTWLTRLKCGRIYAGTTEDEAALRVL